MYNIYLKFSTPARLLFAFIMVGLLNLDSFAQREESIPSVGFTVNKQQDDQVRYAVDGNYMARTVINRSSPDDKNPSLAELQIFEYQNQRWVRVFTDNLKNKEIWDVKDIDLDGNLVVLSGPSTQNIAGILRVYGHTLLYYKSGSTWYNVSGTSLRDTNDETDGPGGDRGYNVEIYDAGNAADSRLVISSPRSITSTVEVYEFEDTRIQGFRDAYGVVRNPIATFTYRNVNERSYYKGYRLALNEDYLAVVLDGVVDSTPTLVYMYDTDELGASNRRVEVRRDNLPSERSFFLFENGGKYEQTIDLVSNGNGNGYLAYACATVTSGLSADQYRNFIRIVGYNNSGVFDSNQDAIISPPAGQFKDFFGFYLDLELYDDNFVLGVGAQSTFTSNEDDGKGAIYLYKNSATSLTTWQENNPFAIINGETNGQYLGRNIQLGSGGLIAPNLYGREAIFYNFKPEVPQASSYSISAGRINLNVEPNAADASVDSDFKPNAYRLTSNKDDTFLSESTDGSFNPRLSELGLAAGEYGGIAVTGKNRFLSSDPVYLGAYRSTGQNVSGTVTLPVESGGAGVAGVAVSTDYKDNKVLNTANKTGTEALLTPVDVFPDNFTIEFWANVDKSNGPSNESFLLGYTSNGSKNDLLFGFAETNLRIDVDERNYTMPVTFTPNTWVHYAFSVDGQKLKLYVNGGLEHEADLTNYTGITDGGVLSLFEEQDQLGGGFDFQQSFFGQVDEFRVWEDVRTDAEIANNYRSSLRASPVGNDNLMINYQFQEVNQTGNFKIAYNEAASSKEEGPFYHAYNKRSRSISSLSWEVTSDLALKNSAFTGINGAYTLEELELGEYTLTPGIPGEERGFDPDQQTVTLSTQQLSRQEVNFIDTTSFPVAGQITFLFNEEEIPSKGVKVVITRDGQPEVPVESLTTDAAGNFTTALLPGNYIVTPEFHDHTFSPASLDLNLPENQDTPLEFTNTTTRTVSGTFSGGSCALNVGGMTLKAANPRVGLEVTNVNTLLAPTDTIHRYQVELPALIDDSVAITITALEDDENLVLEKLVQGEGGFIRAEQFVFVDSTDATADFFYRSPTQVEIVRSTLNEIDCFENTYLMKEEDEFELAISAFEIYDGQRCDVDSAEVKILDDISDRADSIAYIRPSNVDNFSYTLLAGNPNVVGGGQRPYQKALQIDVTPPGAPTVTNTLWAIVEGSTPRAGQPFLATKPANVPLFILRDPPGDRSFSFIEESNTITQNISFTKGSSGGVDINWLLGDPDQTIFQDKSINLGFDSETTNSVNLSVSTESRISTSAEDGVFPGKPSDLFVGMNMNVLYGLTDVLRYNAVLCKATLTQDITFSPGTIASNYIFSYNEIKNSIIPDLETAIESTIDPAIKASLEDDILAWERLVEYNDLTYAIKASPDSEVKNISFGGESGVISESESYSNTSTSSYQFNVFAENNLELGIGTSVPVPFVGPVKVSQKSINISTGFQSNTSNSVSSEETFKVGFDLADDDAGDLFSVDVIKRFESTNLKDSIDVGLFDDVEEIARDAKVVADKIPFSNPLGRLIKNLIDGAAGSGFDFNSRTPLTAYTPFFDVLGGKSSAPWEGLPTVPRDSAQITVSPLNQADVDPNGEAVFTLNVGNLSQSGDTRDVTIRVLPGSNPDGLIITSGAGRLTSNDGIRIEDIPANESRTITFTAKRGPLAYDYRDIAIVALSPFELAATLGNQRLSDTAYFSVSFETLCEPVSVFLPEENWVVNANSNNTMRVVIDEYDKQNIERVLFQYRRMPAGLWETLGTVSGSDLEENYTAVNVDLTGVDNGAYQFRAATECESGLVFSDYYDGFIDIMAPQLIADPEPSDGVLSPNDVITLRFNEDIDVASVKEENIILTNAQTGDTLEVEFVYNERLIGIGFDTEDPDTEKQLFQVTVRRISDRYGNVIAPLKWSFVVNSNPVSWQFPSIVENMLAGETHTFDAQLINNGGAEIAYELQDLPSWLEVIGSTAPVIQPGGSRFISFRVTNPSALASGSSYQETINLVTDLGEVPLEVNLKVSCPGPSAWTVDANAFSNRMEVTLNPTVGNLSLAQPNDQVAAFVGNQVRGVTEVYKLVPDDNYVAYLEVFSNQATGETISFKLFDASECAVVDLSQTIPFENNTALGSPDQPDDLGVDETQIGFQEIQLSEGINWISFNVEQSDMSVDNVLRNLGLNDASYVSNLEGDFAQFLNFVGWKGTLDTLQTGTLYKLNVTEDTVLRLVGKPATVGKTINPGWNGVGIIQQEASLISQAFTGFTPAEGDRIQGINSSATYRNGMWQGSLEELLPGSGYLLQSGTVQNNSRIANNEFSIEPAAFNTYMNVVATLEIDGVEYHGDQATIGAFIGESCRGFAQPVLIQNQWIFLVTAYGGLPGDTLSFRYQLDGEEVFLEQQVAFENEAVEGEVRVPFVLQYNNPEILQQANLAPTALTLSDSVLANNSTSGVGLFAALDPNPGESFTYTLVSGEGDSNNALFRINEGELLAVNPISFVPGGENRYTIRVQVADRAGASIVQTFSITVIEEASQTNNAPTAIALSNDSILFTLNKGDQVGELSVTDPDQGDVHTYQISSINNDADSKLFIIEGNKLVVNEDLSQSMSGIYEVVIVVSDGKGGEYTQTLNVTITEDITSTANLLRSQFLLGDFQPNPTYDQGSFSYTLPVQSKITISVIDMLGKVWQQQSKVQAAGRYAATLDLAGLPDGVYIYSIQTAGNNPQTRMKRLVKMH